MARYSNFGVKQRFLSIFCRETLRIDQKLTTATTRYESKLEPHALDWSTDGTRVPVQVLSKGKEKKEKRKKKREPHLGISHPHLCVWQIKKNPPFHHRTCTTAFPPLWGGKEGSKKGKKKPLDVGQRSKCISRAEGGGHFVSASPFHHW